MQPQVIVYTIGCLKMLRRLEVIQQFEEAVSSEAFVLYEKEFSQKIRDALGREYSKGEVPTVKALETYVDQVNNLSKNGMSTYRLPFTISTRSVFIHGNKSMVEFSHYGSRVGPIELGDLIFVVSVIFNGKKYFEKMSICQFKIDNKKHQLSWYITNKEQLFLLSKFPPFKSIRGLIPKGIDYFLPNLSGSLGSYGLIYYPGDFIFISARSLDSFSRKSAVRRKGCTLQTIYAQWQFIAKPFRPSQLSFCFRIRGLFRKILEDELG